MNISASWVSAGCAVAMLFVVLAGGVIKNSLDTRDEAIGKLRETAKNLFEKYDKVAGDLAVYKLHVAETYVNEAKLEKLLHPFDRRLENIETALRSRPA